MGIKENLSTINERILNRCRLCGRTPSSIKLIAVSKTKPVSDILEAISVGQLVFGENYAQELRDKAKEILSVPSDQRTNALTHRLEWHFIGHVQKNKIKYVVPVANWIHTIDSVELLEEIIKKTNPPSPPFSKGGMGGLGPSIINCLIEVNIADESSKSGINESKVFELVKAFSAIAQSHDGTIALRGLMCMPPISDNPETSRPYFRKLKSLLDDINSRNMYPEKLTELSMGMTQDFEVAIEKGATMLRIGTAIFSGRNS